MTDSARCCPACGRERPAASPPSGPCPFCLLQLGLDAPAGADSPWLDPGNWSCRILSVLGVEDTMTSYLAEQEAPTRRLVVLTQLDVRLESDEKRSRAAAALSKLVGFNHALVARILGGLVSEAGAVRLVSEYVPGMPIHRYCARTNADARQRASLCLSVVEAIQAAHEHGIVHGRLAPARVVVTTRHGSAAPVVTGLGSALMTGQAGDPPVDAAALAALARTLGLDVPAGPWSTARELADRLRGLTAPTSARNPRSTTGYR